MFIYFLSAYYFEIEKEFCLWLARKIHGFLIYLHMNEWSQRNAMTRGGKSTSGEWTISFKEMGGLALNICIDMNKI